ncbi:hypothetical protein F5B22DRAFT_632196 [Xylaria bambusicola]|uniref:uncharacterized protein n=1 Tax=Xylaria bambusicola TaxID=326684 RepID=UPI0020074855|nr:uncharacterized protein F5B22DRAFT_632196 [Xylaria bambusicola]KAI0502740.1 hypothetical protein F5B22DRAFT_632196 [Xylaria bambusicola]
MLGAQESASRNLHISTSEHLHKDTVPFLRRQRLQLAMSSMGSPVLDIATPATHTMGLFLQPYVVKHVHPDIQHHQKITQIIITGSPQRYAQLSDTCIDSLRPTVSWIDSHTIHLNCFPSRSLMLHYASVVATYLSLFRRDSGIVHLRPLDSDHTVRLIRESNLQAIGKIDLAIIGNVNNLTGLEGLTDHWYGFDRSEFSIFRWQKFTSRKHQAVAVIGCLEQLWGDTGGHILRALCTQLNVKCVIYIAKCGSLSEEYTSNGWIATGTKAFLKGEVIQWSCPLEPVIDMSKDMSKKVARGPIVTVPTPLCETRDWLSEWASKATWVDCEVGFIAKAAVELGVQFGFLVVVSDNLWHPEGQNLSNEDSPTVISARKVLYDQMTKILNSLLLRLDAS